jgi:CheY-like chemotaxis protein
MEGQSILIVDDNAQNLKLARVVLANEGFDVRTAANAEDALQLLRTVTPRLILMDIQLPGMDGLELTRRLKADPATRAIGVIALTAYAMKGDDEKAFAAGCDGYITKPIDVERLPALVSAYLAERSPESMNQITE